jgi:hypothetical protein
MSAPRTDKIDIEVDLAAELRERLSEFCARTGFDEETVFEAALSTYLDEVEVHSVKPKH